MISSYAIHIKPLSVNEAWQGRRVKTSAHKKYRKDVGLLLPNIDVPKDKKLRLDIEWGLSSAGGDIDNPLKPFIDSLCDKYEINDNKIYELNVKKRICAKGAEYIMFNIGEIE